MEVIQEPNRQRFVQRYHTFKTQEIVQLSLKAFDKYLESRNIKEYELFAKISTNEDERYFFLDDLVQFWKDTKSPKTIRTYFTFIRAYLRQNRVKTTTEDVKDYVSFPKQIREIRKPLTVEKIKQLFEYCGPQQKAFFLMLLSSGMRASEGLKLVVGNVDTSSKPCRITIPAVNTKTMQERECYISKEALLYMEPYLRGKQPHQRIFTITLKNVEIYMGWLRKKTGLLAKYSNNVNYEVNIHAFRAYFHTQATLLHGVEYAHAVLGHGSYLQQYFRMTPEIRLEKYRQLEPYLTIYDDAKLQAENQHLKEKLDTVESMKEEMEKLKAEMARILHRK